MRRSNYTIVEDRSDRMVLRDMGPWERHPTITNDAENVVEDLAPRLKGRPLFYYDSEGELTELKIVDGRLAGFKAVNPGVWAE